MEWCARFTTGLATLVFVIVAGAADAQNQVSVFAGKQVADGWENVFLDPGNLDWQDSGVVGIAVGREWPVWRNVSVGFEAQVLQHFGVQDHAEFDLPLTLRSSTDRVPLLRSLAFGIGPSYATEVPPIEVQTKGESQKALLYWMLEAEFASPSLQETIYARLHHRSNAWGAIAPHGGSNILVIGLRHRW